MNNRKQKKQAVLAKRVAAVQVYKKRCQVKAGAVKVSALTFSRIVHRQLKAYSDAGTTGAILESMDNIEQSLNEQLKGYATGPDGTKIDLRDLDVGAMFLGLRSKHLTESRDIASTDGYKVFHDEDKIPLPDFMSGLQKTLDGGFQRGDFTIIAAKTDCHASAFSQALLDTQLPANVAGGSSDAEPSVGHWDFLRNMDTKETKGNENE